MTRKLAKHEIDLLIRIAEAARDCEPLDWASMQELYDLVDIAIVANLIDKEKWVMR